MTTGQWLTSPNGVRWFFEAGAESIDFGYTGDWCLGIPDWERLQEPRDLEHWLAARDHPVAVNSVTSRNLDDAKALRDAIVRLVAALTDEQELDPTDIDTLNSFASRPDIPPAFPGGSHQASATTLDVDQVLSHLARDAIAILSEPERLHRCDADDCRMIFRDESRTANRRWCSMQRCGNRAKVRAHRTRTRTPHPVEPATTVPE